MRLRLSIPLLLLAATSAAQTHKVAAPQKVTRAVAVYEYTGTLDHPAAARLVPVSLFIDGHLEDAGVYLSRPIPFALRPGLLYSVELAGEPVGTFNIDSSSSNLARNRAAATNPDNQEDPTWYGVGRFTPPPTAAELAAKQKRLKPSATVGVIVGSNGTSSDDDRPSFIRRQPAAGGPPDPATTASNSTPVHTGTNDAGDDKPTLNRRDGTISGDSKSDPTPDTDAAKKKPRRQKPAGYVTGPADSLNDDPDRPSLHRGTPSEDLATPVLLGLPADLRQVAAVSDNTSRDDHPFAYNFDSAADRASTLTAIETLARVRLAAYIATNYLQPVSAALAGRTAPLAASTASVPGPTGPVLRSAPGVSTPIVTPSTSADPYASAPSEADHKLITRTNSSTATPTPPAAPSAARPPTKTPIKPTTRSRTIRRSAPSPIVLTQEDLRAYQLTYGGAPTFVYSVQVPVATGGPVYLTLIAQRLATGDLQPALTAITDAAHLDRSPWLRPIDVVDPDAAHRGNLIMELRGRTTREFALYRLVTAQAEQTFVTGPLE